MASSPPLILRLVASSVMIANQAGKIIRDVMAKGELSIVYKGDKSKNDFSTEADRSAETCIISSLASLFPSITIIGEEGRESGHTHKMCDVPPEWIISDVDEAILAKTCPPSLQTLAEKDIVVWVDPLDGTREYTQGFLDHVTVLIGISAHGKALAGVIHQPFYNYQNKESGAQLGRTIWGIQDLGVGGYTPNPPPANKRIITTTRSHNTSVVQAVLDAMKPDEVVRVGGAGNKVLLVMEGKAHAYVYANAGCKRWDTCAPEAILNAQGGLLTDVHGVPYDYTDTVDPLNKGGVIATAVKSEHDYYISRIPQEVKDKLVS
ncbi:hypothetical protein M8J76_005778 [Diaphorina citri]|nr:hypothetical protein M8J76_005778 [Diaphorina citri]KAI5746123.1 hypothetical protein M8J77_000169 [Diaphorina citri]